MLSVIRGIIAASAMAALLLLRCVSLNQVAGGSSSETVIGKVANEDGTPACSTIVTLCFADYNPVCDTPLARSSTDTTDAFGAYRVTAPDSSARYSIIATKPGSGTRALVANIVIRGDTTHMQDAVLSLPGVISVAAPDTADVINGYLYIPGTGIAVFVNGGGLILLDQVPAGTIPSVNYASKAASGVSSVLTAGINVISADTVVIPYPQWRYSRKVHFNTTASGAGVYGDVADFPVLIRLTSSTFVFSQARADGADLRFSSPDGEHLAYEIEQWDATANVAALWVRVPAVLGNYDSQHIVMHWGISTGSVTGSLSNSTVVFDTAAGFQGVWHLSGLGNGTAFDATANGYHGTPYNMSAASAVAGAIGSARDFNGSASYITMPNSAAGKLDLPQNGTYSISLWAYADTVDSLWHAIAGKGHEQYYLKLKCFGNGRATWEFVEFQDQKGWEYTEDSTPPAPGQKQWVYLAGVRSGSQQLLYVNGTLANNSIPLQTGNYPRNSNDHFTIGRHARQVTIPYVEGWCYFNGKIDEVRVMNFAPSADWIRLCYMNQKAADALVEFR
jgi:hypothetical protein